MLATVIRIACFLFNCFMLYCALPLARLVCYIWNKHTNSPSRHNKQQYVQNTVDNVHNTPSVHHSVAMAPKKKSGNRKNGSTTDLVEMLRAEIKSVEKEIRLGKRRLEKAIRDVQLEVVCHKSELCPETLYSNLYKLMQRENEALFINKVDGYLDCSTVKTRQVMCQDETQRPCLADDSTHSLRTLVDTNQSRTSNLTVNSNKQNASKKSIDAFKMSAVTRVDIIKQGISKNAIEKNICLTENCESVDMSDKSNYHGTIEIQKELGGKAEMNTRDKTKFDSKEVDVLCENINKRCSLKTDNSEKISNYIIDNFRNGIFNESIDLGTKTENSKAQEVNKDSENFIFQACIEENLPNMVSTECDREKPIKWQEKYDNYKKVKHLQENTNERCNTKNRSPKHQNTSVQNVARKFSVQENFNNIISQNTSEVVQTKNKSNQEHDAKRLKNNKEYNKNDANSIPADKMLKLKSPLLSKTNIARTTFQKPTSFQNKSLFPSITDNCQLKYSSPYNDKNPLISASKARNILRASKLVPPVDNLNKMMGICENSDSQNSGISETANRIDTPRKTRSPNQRIYTDQRSTSKSKIPKFVTSSPLPKSNKSSVNVNLMSNSDQSSVKPRRPISCPNGYSTTLIRNKIMLNGSNYNNMKLKGSNMLNKNLNNNTHEMKDGQANTKVSQIKPSSLKHIEKKSKTVHLSDINNRNKYKNIESQISKSTSDNLPNEIISLYKNLEIGKMMSGKEANAKDSDAPGIIKPHNAIASQKSTESVPLIASNYRDTIEPPHANVNKAICSNNIGTQSPSFDNEYNLASKPTKETLTTPKDIFVLRNDIPTKQTRYVRPINFIQRNKERIKKIVVKNRRSSKTKTKNNKFRNSIVIDSRYLKIFNQILTDRRCSICKQDQTECLQADGRSNLISRDKTCLSKQSKETSSNVYIKFSESNQLKTFLSEEIKGHSNLNSLRVKKYREKTINMNTEEHKGSQNKSEIFYSGAQETVAKRDCLDGLPDKIASNVCNENNLEKNQLCRFVYVASTERIRKSETEVITEEEMDGQPCLQSELKSASSNIVRDSVEIVEMQQERGSKCNSQGSVAGSSLVSYLKTDSVWREYGKRSSRRYSGLEYLSDKSSTKSDRNNNTVRKDCRIEYSPHKKNTNKESCQISLEQMKTTETSEVKDVVRSLVQNAFDECNAKIEIDEKSLEFGNTTKNRSFDKSTHDNSSDIIKAHKTLEKLGISSIEKTRNEIYTLNSTKETHQTPIQNCARHKTVDDAVERNRNSALKVVPTKGYATNVKKNNTTSNLFQTTKNNSVKSNCDISENVIQNKINTNKSNKNITNSSQNIAGKSLDMDKSVEVITDKLNYVKQEMEDLSFKELYNSDNSCEKQQKIIKLEAKSPPTDGTINIINQYDPSEDDSSVEYLGAKIKTNARKSENLNQIPFSLVPIENLLSTQCKNEGFDRLAKTEMSLMDPPLASEISAHREILKNKKSNEKKADHSLNEFEMSMDHVFTSTKHNICQTPVCRGSINFKTPRTASTRKTPCLNSSLKTRPQTSRTPNSSTAKTVLKPPQFYVKSNSTLSEGSLKLRQTPTGSVKMSKVLDKSPKMTPKNPAQKTTKIYNLVSSTPIQQVQVQEMHIKKEPQ